MAQKENELKYLLTEASYHALLALVEQQGEPLVFSNVYYVAAESGKRRDWVLRLRRSTEGTGELTLKVGRQVSPGTFSSTEYSATVESSDPSDWEDTEPIRIFRQEISRAALVLQGQTTNERRLVRAPLGPVSQWEVDRTELPNGKVGYELEIEYPLDVEPTIEELNGFRAELDEWMFEQAIKSSPSTKTKYRRFLESVGSY